MCIQKNSSKYNILYIKMYNQFIEEYVQIDKIRDVVKTDLKFVRKKVRNQHLTFWASCDIY